MPDLNEDIVDNKVKLNMKFDTEFEQYNVVLMAGLQEQKDYIFCTKEMWGVISHYSGNTIKRLV